MRKILVRPAVGDQPVTAGFQAELVDQTLHCGEEVGQKVAVLKGERLQPGQSTFGDEQDVHRVSWLRMVESDEGSGFAQAVQRDGKAHMGEHPTDEELDQRYAQ